MNQHQYVVLPASSFTGFKGWIYLAVSCSFLFLSCARYYYAPNSVNIPLLNEKEAKINIQYATGTISNGFECQSAFAITPHFGGMMNTMLGGSNDDEYDLSTGKTKTSYIEIGGGYFTPIHSSPFIFENYCGIGTGGVKNSYDPGSSKVTYTKVFLQPNLGIKVKGFEFGISSRFNWVKHNVASLSGSSSDYYFADLDYITNHPVSFYWEPGIVLRGGGRNFMAQMQYTGSVNLTHSEDQFLQELGYFTFGCSIPIHYKTPAQ